MKQNDEDSAVILRVPKEVLLALALQYVLMWLSFALSTKLQFCCLQSLHS